MVYLFDHSLIETLQSELEDAILKMICDIAALKNELDWVFK